MDNLGDIKVVDIDYHENKSVNDLNNRTNGAVGAAAEAKEAKEEEEVKRAKKVLKVAEVRNSQAFKLRILHTNTLVYYLLSVVILVVRPSQELEPLWSDTYEIAEIAIAHTVRLIVSCVVLWDYNTFHSETKRNVRWVACYQILLGFICGLAYAITLAMTGDKNSRSLFYAGPLGVTVARTLNFVWSLALWKYCHFILAFKPCPTYKILVTQDDTRVYSAIVADSERVVTRQCVIDTLARLSEATPVHDLEEAKRVELE